ncbi:MAG TPA: BrnT family toxin [Candidatus Acidoferrum sp.]
MGSGKGPRANFAKYGVRFADPVTVLEDDLALTMRDPSSDEEERWITLGRNSLGRLIVVIYTWRRDNVRLISARPATAREKSQYEECHET